MQSEMKYNLSRPDNSFFFCRIKPRMNRTLLPIWTFKFEIWPDKVNFTTLSERIQGGRPPSCISIPPHWTNLLTQPKQLFTFWNTNSGSLWAWNQSYAYFALPQYLYLYSFETAQNRGTLSAYGWQNKVDRLEDSHWPPRDPSLCFYWWSLHFVSTHIAEGASQNFVQKGDFFVGWISWFWYLGRTVASDRNGQMRS